MAGAPALPRIPRAQRAEIAPSATGSRARRERLVHLPRGQPGAEPLVGVAALGRDPLGPPHVPVQGRRGVLPGVHLAGGQMVQFHPVARRVEDPRRGQRVQRERQRGSWHRRQTAAAGRSCNPPRQAGPPHPGRAARPAGRSGRSARCARYGCRRSAPRPAARLRGPGWPRSARPCHAPCRAAPPTAQGRCTPPRSSPSPAVRTRPPRCAPAGAAATSRPAHCARSRRSCCAPTAGPWPGQACPGRPYGTGAGSPATYAAGSAVPRVQPPRHSGE